MKKEVNYSYCLEDILKLFETRKCEKCNMQSRPRMASPNGEWCGWCGDDFHNFDDEVIAKDTGFEFYTSGSDWWEIRNMIVDYWALGSNFGQQSEHTQSFIKELFK